MTDLNLENVVVQDPKTNVFKTYRPKEVIFKSGTNKSRFVIAADSYSNSSFLWQNVVPPSSSSILERTLRVAYTAKITVTNAAAPVYGAAGVTFPFLMQMVLFNLAVPFQQVVFWCSLLCQVLRLVFEPFPFNQYVVPWN